MKTYSDSISKRYIQSLVKERLGRMKSNVLALGGPNFDEYIPSLLNNIASSDSAIIRSYEKDNLIFAKQLKQLNSFSKKEQEKVLLTLGDIKYAEAERYIDLDLMGNLSGNEFLISKLLRKQLALQTTKRRAFCFNLTLRTPVHQESHFTKNLAIFLRNILGEPIIIFKECKTKLTKGIEYKCLCRNFSIHVYTYKDSSPMVTCLIQY